MNKGIRNTIRFRGASSTMRAVLAATGLFVGAGMIGCDAGAGLDPMSTANTTSQESMGEISTFEFSAKQGAQTDATLQLATDGELKADKKDKYEKAKGAQGRAHAALMKKKNVIGTGVGFNADGSANIVVFKKAKGDNEVPTEIEGHKTKVEVVGDIKAMGFTGTYRSPVPAGISVGNNNEGSSGTIGAVVQKNGIRYILSNNHVLARSNAARLGEAIVQPGRADAYAPGQIATLTAYKPISFTTANNIDGAIAQYNVANTSSMVNNYYKPNYQYYMNAYPGLAVKKVGRTTGYTQGTVTATNVTITVGYPGGTATFTNQIYVSGPFIQAGDSGSLMVSQSGNYPVALNFAGSATASFANPILPVLQYFGVSFAS